MAFIELPRLNGPTFLLYYLFLVVVVASVARALNRRLSPSPNPQSLRSMSPVEVGYLLGGTVRALMVSLASLLARGVVTEGPKRQLVEGPGAKKNEPLERILVAAVRGGEDNVEALLTSRHVLKQADKALAETDERLQDQGWLYRPGKRGRSMWMFFAAAVFLFGIGVWRIYESIILGYSNLFFLVALMLASVVVLFVAVPVRGRIPALAKNWLTIYANQMRPWQQNVKCELENQEADEMRKRARDVAMCAALFGGATLGWLGSERLAPAALASEMPEWSLYTHGVALDDGRVLNTQSREAGSAGCNAGGGCGGGDGCGGGGCGGCGGCG